MADGEDKPNEGDIKRKREIQRLSIILIYRELCKIYDQKIGVSKRWFEGKFIEFYNENFPVNASLTEAVLSKGFTSLNNAYAPQSSTFDNALVFTVTHFLNEQGANGVDIDYSNPQYLETALREFLNPSEFQRCIKIFKFNDLQKKIQEIWGQENENQISDPTNSINPEILFKEESNTQNAKSPDPSPDYNQDEDLTEINADEEEDDNRGAKNEKLEERINKHERKYVLRWVKNTMGKHKRKILFILGIYFVITIGVVIFFLANYVYYPGYDSFVGKEYLKPFLKFNSTGSDIPMVQFSTFDGGRLLYFGDTSGWSNTIEIDPKDTLAVDIHYHNTGTVPSIHTYIKLNFTPDLGVNSDVMFIKGEIAYFGYGDFQGDCVNSTYLNITRRASLTFDSTFLYWIEKSTGDRPPLPYKQSYNDVLKSGIDIGTVLPGQEGDVAFKFFGKKDSI